MDTLKQFFNLNGLGITMPVVNNLLHNFYAHTFSHCSTLCYLVVIGGEISLLCHGNHYILAYGLGKYRKKSYKKEVRETNVATDYKPRASSTYDNVVINEGISKSLCPHVDRALISTPEVRSANSEFNLLINHDVSNIFDNADC